MKETLYKLVIIDSTGNSYEVHGGAQLLEAWKAYSEVSFEQQGKVIIEGVSDSLLQEAVRYAIDPEIIKGMILVEL